MLEKSDIIVYIPVYNDLIALKHNLKKLDKLGLKALVVDGRFTDFPQINNDDYSSDGLQEFIQDTILDNPHSFDIHKPCREQDKLNYAMRQAFSDLYCKVFMYIGADAYLQGDIDEFLINLTRQYERFVTGPAILQILTEETQPGAKWNNTATRQPRILLNYHLMEARHTHWAMFEKGAPDDMPLEHQQVVVEGLKIIHDNTIRPKERDDLMTAYQNTNVLRERRMFMNHIAKKAYDTVKLERWYEDVCNYPTARRIFLASGSTHLVMANQGFSATNEIMQAFEEAITIRNNTYEAVPILSAVYKVGDEKITMDPTGKHLDSLPNYPAVRKMYSAEGIKPTAAFMAIPWTVGPIICMDRRTVSLIDNMGDEIDFMTFTNQLGLRKEAVTDIRV